MIFRESAIFNQEGISFHIREWLPECPSSGLVFLLHGLSDHGGRFKYVGENLANQGFIFYAPDLRGNGQSEGKRGHFNSYGQILDDIDFIFRSAIEKHPGSPCFIYGQSMGGNLAINYCMSRQPSILGVISSSPWLRLVKSPSAIIRFVGLAVGKLLPSLSLSNGLDADDLTHDPVISKAYKTDPLIHGRITLNTFDLINSSGEWIFNNTDKLKIPLLLMHGNADRITSFDASRQLSLSNISNCTFLPWEGMFHELHNEPDKDLVLKAITDWIKTQKTN